MKRTTLLVAAAALAASLAPPASAASIAYCNFGSVNGAISYTPPLMAQAPSMQPVDWVLHLHMECVGSAPSAGTYDMTIHGKGFESCTTGTSQGIVTSGVKSNSGGPANGPIVSGYTTLTRIGVHYWGYPPYGNGSITVANAEGSTTYTMHIWLDNVMTPGPGVSCPGAGTPIIGHGVIYE